MTYGDTDSSALMKMGDRIPLAFRFGKMLGELIISRCGPSMAPQANVFNSLLPDILRIKPSGVQNNRLKVYEEFSTSIYPFISVGR